MSKSEVYRPVKLVSHPFSLDGLQAKLVGHPFSLVRLPVKLVDFKLNCSDMIKMALLCGYKALGD